MLGKLQKLSSRLGTTAAWAAVSAMFRAVFFSIIETFGWGPLLSAALLGGATAAVTWAKNAPWYWVVIPGLIAFAVVLWLAVKVAKSLKDAPASGNGTLSPSIDVNLGHSLTRIGGYQTLCAIEITNNDPDGRDFKDACLVKIDDMTIGRPEGAAWPFALRTDAQTTQSRSGRFNLSHRERKTVPVLFQGTVRKNEWWLLDELGHAYLVPSQPMRMLLGVYGAGRAVKAVLTIGRGPQWSAQPELKIVSDDYQLEPVSDIHIETGDGEEFERRNRSTDPYSIEKTKCIVLQNKRRDRSSIQNCKVTLTKVEPEEGFPYALPITFADGISLDPQDRRPIPIVSYNEAIGSISRDDIMVLETIPAESGDPKIPLDLDVILTIKVTGRDTAANEVRCRAYVSDGKLHLEKA